MGNHTTNMSSPNEINENVTGTQPVTDTSTHNLNDNPDPVLDEQKEPDAPAEQHEEKATDEAKEVVLAAHNGGTERLRALLEANPNLVDSVDAEDHTGANNIGASALFCASRAGHVAVVQFLLTFGASVDLAKPNGATPLHVASQENHVEVVAVLLDGGASVDGGYTPLFAASAKNSIGAMKQLLAAGASRDIAVRGYTMEPNTRYHGGLTPLQVAKHFNHTAAVELLEAWPLISPHLLMVATITGNSAAVRELLHSGEDPVFTVQHQQHTLSALVLARNEATCSWAAPVCTDTLHLIERSLQWSPYDLKAHYLFPPAFRRGVRHVLGLMVALERAGCGLPQHIRMLIIASLPRDWGLIWTRRFVDLWTRRLVVIPL